MSTIQLCSGILCRGDSVLLVACRYEGESQPLWTLPGGRQEIDTTESVEQTMIREFQEETSLPVRVRELAYVSESFGSMPGLHVLNCTFFVDEANAAVEPRPVDERIVTARFVSKWDAPGLLAADVLRIPVAAALSGKLSRRYFFFNESNVSVPFLKRPSGTGT